MDITHFVHLLGAVLLMDLLTNSNNAVINIHAKGFA